MDVRKILPLSIKYEIAEVTTQCEKHLLEKKASLNILLLAQRCKLPKLIQHGIEFMAEQSFTENHDTPDFNEIHKDNLSDIMKLRLLYMEAKNHHDGQLDEYGDMPPADDCCECDDCEFYEYCEPTLEKVAERFELGRYKPGVYPVAEPEDEDLGSRI